MHFHSELNEWLGTSNGSRFRIALPIFSGFVSAFARDMGSKPSEKEFLCCTRGREATMMFVPCWSRAPGSSDRPSTPANHQR